jgi:hypothetical protein
LPPLSFDQAVFSRSAILDFVGRYLDEQNGCVDRTGPKGQKSRNRIQEYKLGDWKSVELARRRNSKRDPFTRDEQKVRSRAKKQALQYYTQVLAGYIFAQANLLVPKVTRPLTGVVEKRFLISQLKRVVAEVFAKTSEARARLSSSCCTLSI